ncbi:MAG: O-antigen ligase family protein [Rhodospirillales bacterium]|nr:O-antigen ligase family protein [Rhodospirillales bacterium]
MPDVARLDRLAWRVAFGSSLALAPMLLMSRALSDALISLTGVLFLALCFGPRGDWGWARRPWHALGLAFWVWQIATSILRGDGHQIIESVVLIRIFVFLAALEVWVLRDAQARRWFGYAVLATALWVGIEIWQQYLTGHNIFHEPPWGDGSLTGPIRKPRAGETFALLAFPAFLPVVVPLLQRKARAARIAGAAGLVLMAATQVLIGQRMPTMLMLLGLCVAALMLPRLRFPVAAALAAGAALAALLRFLAPLTYYKLVVHFSEQMRHFMATQYAALFERAFAMIVAHPWFGLGFDGFRDHCLDIAYRHDLSWFSVPDAAGTFGCSIHPHNYYLQVATGAGLPGLALFVALGVAWLIRLGRGAGGSARRLGPFVAASMILWPVASTTSFFTLPNLGWILIALGWGLAEARRAA